MIPQQAVTTAPAWSQLCARAYVGLHGYGQIAVLQSYDECIALRGDGTGSEMVEFIRVLEDASAVRISVERYLISVVGEITPPPPQDPDTPYG